MFSGGNPVASQNCLPTEGMPMDTATSFTPSLSRAGLTSLTTVLASSWQKNHPNDLISISTAFSSSRQSSGTGTGCPSVTLNTSRSEITLYGSGVDAGFWRMPERYHALKPTKAAPASKGASDSSDTRLILGTPCAPLSATVTLSPPRGRCHRLGEAHGLFAPERKALAPSDGELTTEKASADTSNDAARSFWTRRPILCPTAHPGGIPLPLP
mmetsp:Transcript_30195/g.70478  ORF Transcript_30195/g.70478 Transcript_30195/m.70478 type:complete len:213 (-) Transcript_30195:9-647(-)